MHRISEIVGQTHVSTTSSIFTRFQETVERFPQELAVVCTHQSADLYGLDSLKKTNTDHGQSDYLRWSFETLGQSVEWLQRGLAAHGPVNETVFFVFCENQVESVMSLLSSYSLGWTFVPMNLDQLCNRQEVQHMIELVITGKRPAKIAVLANNPETASRFDSLELEHDLVKICLVKYQQDWLEFGSLIRKHDYKSLNVEHPSPTPEELSVFFTSGTTSFPKGCLINAPQRFDVLEPSLNFFSTEPGDLVNVAVSNHHAFGYICMVFPLLRGSSVVFAGPRFSPQETEKTLRFEACTHTAMAPTMLHGMIQMLEGTRSQIQSLRSLLCASMAMSCTLAQKCKDILGISTIENFYGMTEGVFLSTGSVRDLSTVSQDDCVSIGKPVSSSHIRVCAPNDRLPLPIGVPGILHFSGPSMIDQYLGCESDDFYHQDEQSWFVTGDQAFVDQKGQVFILGRHKDIIIRGGKNISPTKIEDFLNSPTQTPDLDPQVIAGKDDIAGEVPILVTGRSTSHEEKDMIRASIREGLGVPYVPRVCVSLQSLGLDDYPRTTSGKIQKGKLSEAVEAHASSQATDHADRSDSSLKLSRDIIATWSRVLGIQASAIDIAAPISQLADSIIMLDARERIRKDTGLSVPLPQWLAMDTIEDQINLFQEIPTKEIPNEPVDSPQTLRAGPPSFRDMVHLGGDESGFNATRKAIETKIAAQGLSWDDVEDVFPCKDFVQIISRSQVVKTWNIRTSIVSQNASLEELQTALKATLINNPLLLSYIVVDDEAFGPELSLHVTLRQSQKALDQCIVNYGTVGTLDDVRTITMNYPFKDHSQLPGPLCRCLLFFVQETNSAAVVTNISHAVYDAIVHSMLHEDLDCALSGQQLRPHTSFKSWAETYHVLRKSPMAASDVRFHEKYLADLQNHKSALWPHPTHQIIISPERAMKDGHLITFAAPSFVRLKQRYPHLSTPIVLKAALALMIILHTNHTHALFLNFETSRSKFPFIHENCPFSNAPDSADVAGPTFGGVLSLIGFQPTETVLEYLTRIQEDQKKLTEHANVPWHGLSSRLGYSMAELIPTISQALIFDWMPGLGRALFGENPYRNITVTQTHIQSNLGMLASAGAGGTDGSQIVIFLHGALANVSSMWVERAANEWKDIALWLGNQTSLEMPVGEFVNSIGSAASA